MGEPKRDDLPSGVLTVGQLRALIREELAALAARPAVNDDRLLTTREAAAYLGVSVRVLHGHVGAGRLVPDSPQRPGFAAHRFYRSTLDAFMVRR